jgi:glycogen debranching enzyme
MFWDLAGRYERPIPVSTWSSLAPLALPSLPEEIGRRIVEEQILDSRRFATPFGIPSVSLEEPSFRAGWHLFRCWRGPTWVNTGWLLIPAMRRLGYTQEAERILASYLELIARHGFREYYNPLNGEGLAARHFGWSTLLVDLVVDRGDHAGLTDARASTPRQRAPGDCEPPPGSLVRAATHANGPRW